MLEHLSAWIYTQVATILVYRYKQAFYLRTKTELPIILVGGNVGKSTATLTLTQLFEPSYTVLSGTSQTQNLNTPLGLIATLLGRKNLANKSTGNNLLLVFLSLFQKLYPAPNTILIQEVGVDQQYGADRYLQIFDQVSMYIAVAIASEHASGFSSTFDRATLNKLHLPAWLESQLKNQSDPILANVYLEQCKLIKQAKVTIFPRELGSITNTLVRIEKGEYTEHTVVTSYQNTQLVANDYLVNEAYLLPITFGVFVGLLEMLREEFSLPDKLSSLIQNIQLPVSRFGFFDGTRFEKVIDSSYNSDPESLKTFLELLKQFSTAHPSIVVLGEMRELGQESLNAHINAANTLKNIPGIQVILLGKEWKKMEEFWPPQTLYFERVGQIITHLTENPVTAKTWLWCKGSQNTIYLEELVKASITPDKHDLVCRQSNYYLTQKTPYLIP